MHIFIIIIHRYVIICIDIINIYDIRAFLYIQYIISIFVTCIIHYICWISMMWYFFTCIAVICYFIIYTNILLCTIFLQSEFLVWKVIQGMFEFLITSSLFDPFELFLNLLLKSELAVIHIHFFELNEMFLPCFPLDDINTIPIYFTSVISTTFQSKFKFKLEKTFNFMSIERRLTVWYI